MARADQELGHAAVHCLDETTIERRARPGVCEADRDRVPGRGDGAAIDETECHAAGLALMVRRPAHDLERDRVADLVRRRPCIRWIGGEALAGQADTVAGEKRGRLEWSGDARHLARRRQIARPHRLRRRTGGAPPSIADQCLEHPDAVIQPVDIGRVERAHGGPWALSRRARQHGDDHRFVGRARGVDDLPAHRLVGGRGGHDREQDCHVRVVEEGGEGRARGRHGISLAPAAEVDRIVGLGRPQTQL